MSFDHDQSEQANISAADFALMCEEMKELREDLNDARNGWEAAVDECRNLAGQRDELLAASKLILRSFGYAPGKGPDWYEAARIAIAKAEAA